MKTKIKQPDVYVKLYFASKYWFVFVCQTNKNTAAQPQDVL